MKDVGVEDLGVEGTAYGVDQTLLFYRITLKCPILNLNRRPIFFPDPYDSKNSRN